MNTTKLRHAVSTFVLIAASLVWAGCGGGGGGTTTAPTSVTLTGAIQTPGGAATYRAAGRGAAQLANLSTAVTVSAYTITSSGETLLASATSGADGSFSITLPAGTSITSTNVILKAAFDASTLRALIWDNTNITISPQSEACAQLIEERIAASTGKTIDDFSKSEIQTLQTQVNTANADVSYTGVTSISDAITRAKNDAIADATVAAALTTAIDTTAPAYYAVFTTTDYSSGQVSAFGLNGSPSLGVSAANNLASVHSDAVIEAGDRYVYVINRLGVDSIQVLDPRNNFAVAANYTTGDSSNPYDIEEISASKAYVSRYGMASVLIVNPTTGAQLGTIDLSAFADTDGKPEMAEMLAIGDKVFVIMQRQANWSPTAPGLVAVIDSDTDTLVDADTATTGTQAITLNCYNPQFIEYLESTDNLYVSCSGDYFDTNKPGGVDVVNPDTYAVSTAITKTTLGGSPGDIAIVSSTRAYIVLSDANYVNSIWSFNPAAGALIGAAALYTAGGYVPEIALDPFGYLLISDTSFTNPGVVFLNTTTDTVSAGPISTGLPPFGIAVITMPTS